VVRLEDQDDAADALVEAGGHKREFIPISIGFAYSPKVQGQSPGNRSEPPLTGSART
jgi:hypothetical protein